MNFWQYIATNYTEILALLLEHIKLTAISVGLAVLIGVPLGIFISYMSKASKIVLSIANVIQAIPSMALVGFMIPFLGIGAIPAVTAVVLYSLLPIIKNTYTGLESINSQTLEAAKGIGLTRFQILTKVQIPLALPVIMTGVRVASVTAVGLMTMAAFIGAGGLGNLVFSGIRTVNNNQILAGAIPACLLALFVDFLLGMIEKLVTPISLQKGNAARKKKKRLVQKITLGSKDYTDQLVLGNLVSEMIEDRTDIQVNRKMNLGGTQVCFSALQSGDIDMYVEYSGTAYSDILQHSPINDVDAVYNTVKTEFKEKYNIEVLSQMKCNNTYILAVKPETAEKYGLSNVSDFAKVASSFKSGTTFEFTNRESGLIGLEQAYNFKIGENIPLDGAPRYTALINDEVDVIDAFATDGLLKKFELSVLEDDKGFFTPYYAMPIMSEKALEEYPEIVPILEELGNVLTNDVMSELNYRVDVLQQSPEQVAKDFLKESGLSQE